MNTTASVAVVVVGVVALRAVTVQVPAPDAVRTPPEIRQRLVGETEYVTDPAAPPVVPRVTLVIAVKFPLILANGVVVIVNGPVGPGVATTGVDETVTVIVAVAVLYNVKSVGVYVATIVAVPGVIDAVADAPVNVTVVLGGVTA